MDSSIYRVAMIFLFKMFSFQQKIMKHAKKQEKWQEQQETETIRGLKC